MKIQIYEHRSGLSVVPCGILESIKKVVEETSFELAESSVSDIKTSMMEYFERDGWTGEYRLDSASKITISSYHKGVGMCFQTGNYGRIYADLLKLQTLYIKENIFAGIIIVPEYHTAKMLGQNMANFERLVRELPIFSQVITMPIVVIGFNGLED